MFSSSVKVVRPQKIFPDLKFLLNLNVLYHALQIHGFLVVVVAPSFNLPFREHPIVDQPSEACKAVEGV